MLINVLIASKMGRFEKFLLLVCVFWSLNICVYSDPTIVSLTNGKYIGENRDYFVAFEGIPYAEAPIGENRFEPPKPYTETWSDVREAKSYGPKCIQWNHFVPKRLQGDEDCLYLNVYVPNIVKNSTASSPVVICIHGGAFIWGYADYCNPKKMMTLDIIFVTISYRLGPLGFLSTQDEVISGNFGLKDQALALKWVNDNIENFQGDKERITVSGFSAGGASTHLFYMSPLTKNLFKNGISHSGSALNPWVIQENAKEKAYKVAAHVNCTIEDHKEMLKCLKEQPAEKIVSIVGLLQPFLDNPFSPFGVVVEPPSDHAFLLDFPSKLLERGEIYKAPWIASASIDEGLYPAGEFMSKEEYLPDVDENWSTLTQHILDFNGTFTDQNHKNEIAEAVKSEYFNNRTITPENFHDLTRIVSDRLYHYGIAKAVEIQSTIAPTFFYYFQFKSQFALGELISGGRTDLGIAHGEDNFLLYPISSRGPFNAQESDLSLKFLEMYSIYAHKSKAQFGGIPMIPVQDKIFNYMNIESPDIYGMKIFEEDYYGNQKFWDKHINYRLEN